MEGHEDDSAAWPPGTVLLERKRNSKTEIILHPVPSDDPDDPLNWSSSRKTVNFTLVGFYVLMTFVLLDIGGVAWGAYMEELGISESTLTSGAAVNYAGLAMGCVMFIPFVYKYGRRPIYIVSLLVQLATSIWNAKLNTGAELIANNLVMGLGGAISETIVLLTIVDLYFVHHHATMNAIFVLLQFGGTYLGPVAAGYIVVSQGWRWIWWWTAILIGVCLVVVLFCFEESQYVPTLQGHAAGHLPTTIPDDIVGNNNKDLKQATEASSAAEHFNTTANIDVSRAPSNERGFPVAQHWPRKSYRQRMALYTKSPSSYSMRVHFFQPVWIVCHIPAVAFAATMYGAVLAWFSVLWTIEATYMYLPPYNFDASSVGLLNLAPFIGCLLAACLTGPLSDWSILFLSKRNHGVFEPEMRLWLLLPAIVLSPAGLLMFGIGLAHGAHWAVLAVGWAMFSFAITMTMDVVMTYVTDSYPDIIGNALVGIVFFRNSISIAVMFAITDWVEAIGLQNFFINVACLAFGFNLLPIPMLIYGKRIRKWTADRYRAYALAQPTHRAI